MPMEQGTIGMLTAGFSIIMGLTFITVALLIFSTKRKPFRVAYGMVIGFIVLFSFAFIQLLNAISFDFDNPMASEEITLRLGTAGVLWAISMLFLLFGLIKFSAVSKNTLEAPR